MAPDSSMQPQSQGSAASWANPGDFGLVDAQPFRALYLHVPFCKQRCRYCDFDTFALPPSDPAMLSFSEEIVLAIMRASRQGRLACIESVYIGGGTPSFLDHGSLTQILYTLSLTLHHPSALEWSIEANPESLSAELVKDMWALGVNRISLGVQSFSDDELAALGRIHDADTAKQAVHLAQGRFENVSIDLMCGIPLQTIESFALGLEQAISLGVTHVSVYPLSIEDGTVFGRLCAQGKMQAPDPDFQADCMELAQELLANAGYARYEVASYAKPGFECRHNIAYWTGVPYLGIGFGASTMMQDASWRVRVKDGQVQDRLDRQQSLAEDLMLGMRMTAGLPESLLERARSEFPHFDKLVADLEAKGLVSFQDGRLLPAARAWLCGNELYGALLDLAP